MPQLSLPLLDRVLVVVVAAAVVHSDKDVDRERVDVASFARTSMFMKGCCLLIHNHMPICVLILCSCLGVTIAIVAIAGLRSGCSGSYCVLVALGGKDVLVMFLIVNVLTLLMLIMNC